MKKRILSLLTCITILSTLVTGCGAKVPTAEELLQNAWGSDEVTSADMIMKIDLEAKIDMSELTGEDTAMNMAIDADIDVKNSENISYMDGSIDINILGMDTTKPIKSYIEKDDNTYTMYEYDSEDDCWYIEEDSSVNMINTESIASIDENIFENLTMDEVSKNSTEYVLRGSISYKDFAKTMDIDMNELMGGANVDDINIDDFKFDTVITFNKETKLIESITFNIDTDSINTEDTEAGAKFTKFELAFLINQINGVDISIPKEVIDNATTKTDDFEYDLTDNELSEELDIDDSEVSDEIKEEESTEDKEDTTLSKYMLGVDYAYEDDIKEILGLYYSTMPEDEVIWSFLTFFNNYTATELCDYMEAYEYWDLNDKIALGILIDIGALDLESTQQYGVDIVEMQSIIDEYVVSLK